MTAVDTQSLPVSDRQPLNEHSYGGLSGGEWDDLLGKMKPRDREAAAVLGYGRNDIAIPDSAVPMLLLLAQKGRPATKCRCLGTLRKLEDPSNEVIDTIIDMLRDPLYSSHYRAAMLLGSFKSRAPYIIPRLLPILESKHADVVEATVFAFGRLGTAAKSVTVKLESMRETSSGKLLRTLDTAISSIGPGID